MVGSVIGPYRIIRLLGEGGMGAVYEAVNESIERRVAIKVLHPDFANRADIATRFLNEARAVNRIAHPSTVQIYEQGRLPDGAAYIVMEFLDGETLSERLALNSGRLPLMTSLLIAWQVAAALDAAHGKGIIHRDLNPSNLMLVPDTLVSGGERVKVLDFGIAKLVADAQKGRTSAELIMGTPTYMSPEQCHGADAVDERTDVYSLGIILFEMLAGQPPFKGDGPGQLIGLHLFQPPPSLKQLMPEIPNEVAALVELMLDKNKSERPCMRDVFDCLTELTGQNEPASPTEIRRRTAAIEPLAPKETAPPAPPPSRPPEPAAPPVAAPAALPGVPALPGVSDPSGIAGLPGFDGLSPVDSQLAPPQARRSWTRLIGSGLIGAAVAGGLVFLAHSQAPRWFGARPQVLPAETQIPPAPTPVDASTGSVAEPMAVSNRPRRPPSVRLPPLRTADVRPEVRPVAASVGAPPAAAVPTLRSELRNPLQDRPTDARPAGTAASGNDVDKILSNAQAEYVNHNYTRAIELARSVQQLSPTRAWRIIGSAACGNKNLPLLKESYQKIDNPGRQYLFFVCQRFGINTETLMGAAKK